MDLMPVCHIAVGIVTHNALASLRLELLEETFHSVRVSFPNCEVFVLDNGSTDGTEDVIARFETPVGKRVRTTHYEPPDGNHTPGRGRNVLLDWMVNETDAEVFVFSDDDMRWKPCAEALVRGIWTAPIDIGARWTDDIVIVSGLLEPEWDWNKPLYTARPSGIPVLVRESAPGAAWTFKAREVTCLDGQTPCAHGIWPNYRHAVANGDAGPFKDDFGYDYEYCRRLDGAYKGLKVAQVDLAEHLGWEASTHGNRANKGGKPLDRERWGI